jgi:ribosome recycling factor
VIDELFADLRESMEKAIKAFHKELGKIRTGRASLSILDGIRVDYYGTPTPLNQLASLSVPESRLIVIQPWEKRLTADIERAIMASDLGLNPTNDGKVVRIAFPPLTEERRKELVKVVGKMAEEARVVVRKARRDAIDMLKDLEKDGEISEDDSRKHQEKVQKVHDEYIEKVAESLARKEKEVLEV